MNLTSLCVLINLPSLSDGYWWMAIYQLHSPEATYSSVLFIYICNVCLCEGAEVKELGSSGVTHLVVASELDVEDIPVVSSRVSVVKVQVC